MSLPSRGALPLEARQAAWDRLWQRLLAPPPQEPDPDVTAEADDRGDTSQNGA